MTNRSLWCRDMLLCWWIECYGQKEYEFQSIHDGRQLWSGGLNWRWGALSECRVRCKRVHDRGSCWDSFSNCKCKVRSDRNIHLVLGISIRAGWSFQSKIAKDGKMNRVWIEIVEDRMVFPTEMFTGFILLTRDQKFTRWQTLSVTYKILIKMEFFPFTSITLIQVSKYESTFECLLLLSSGNKLMF